MSIEKCIILSKYKKKSRKLILRKDLFYMSKHNEKETSKGSLKNSNINSGLRKNSNDIIEKDILSEEEKNENILKNKDSIQIFTKPII